MILFRDVLKKKEYFPNYTWHVHKSPIMLLLQRIMQTTREGMAQGGKGQLILFS